MEFFNNNSILPSGQSGFRKCHSTSTILTKITSDVYEAIDCNMVVSMIFLDFSKAFDTVSHEILLHKFTEIGISDLTLNWLKSYFTNRKQQTIFFNNHSNWLNILAGVPQGPITEPLFF